MSPKPQSTEPDIHSEAESESETEPVTETEPEEDSSSSDSDSDSKRENLKTLLNPFTKSQLITILKTAFQSNPETVSSLLSAAEADPIHRKLFVHGLPWDATEDTLRSGFDPFGPIEECNVVKDKATWNCKGYGFVLFATQDGAVRAVRAGNVRIGGRVVSCQLAAEGGDDFGARRLFVGNVGPGVDPGKLFEFFARFGEIEVGPTGMDKESGKFRGFAKFVYKSADGLRKALEEPTKVFEGCVLKCSVALDVNAKKGGFSGNGNNGNIGDGNSVGLNPGLMAQGLNPSAVLLPQSLSLGGLNMGAVGQIGLHNPAFFSALGGGLNGFGSVSSQVESRMTFDAQGGSSVFGGFGSQAGLPNYGVLGGGIQTVNGTRNAYSQGEFRTALDARIGSIMTGSFGPQGSLQNYGGLGGGVQALSGTGNAFSQGEFKTALDARIGSIVTGSFGPQGSLQKLGGLGAGMQALNGTVGASSFQGESRTSFDAQVGNAMGTIGSQPSLQNYGSYHASQLDRLSAYTRATGAAGILPVGSYTDTAPSTIFPSVHRQ